MRILSVNSDKEFVKRILKPEDYPKLKNKDGTVSTHSMGWGTADNKAYVYPTVVTGKDGNLERLNEKKAWKHAMENREYIEFSDKEYADWFSREYKQVWKKD